jgi:hypothetical protein
VCRQFIRTEPQLSPEHSHLSMENIYQGFSDFKE